MLVRQALYYLSHGSDPFDFSYFLDRIFILAWGWPWTTILLSVPLEYLELQMHTTSLCVEIGSR
jgi:hypothetical protein